MDFMVFNKTGADSVISAILDGKELDGVMSRIIEYAELEAADSNVLRSYLAARLADDDNVLSKLLGCGGACGESLRKAAICDLTKLMKAVDEYTGFDYTPSGTYAHYSQSYTDSIRKMTAAKSPDELFDLLCEHYKHLGCGLFAKYTAFLLDRDGLTGIENPDSSSFDKLVGLDNIKKILIDNTQTLIDGGVANNVLLFGDRGTGKSSCVKALLNMFAPMGLRVIELPKSSIGQIPSLFKILEKKPQKFILYLDDLSFEKHEPEYRSLKVAMDGQLGCMPQNVLIYATSNRRHLIKENWKDREGGDVHANDNMQEMLSLSERFGISLVFSAPNQREYLDIVAKLLADRGISITPDIERRAVVWQMNYGGRTPRCAAQFAAAYKAETDENQTKGTI